MSELVWAPVRVRIGDLRPWERNPRRIRPAHAKRLLKSVAVALQRLADMGLQPEPVQESQNG